MNFINLKDKEPGSYETLIDLYGQAFLKWRQGRRSDEKRSPEDLFRIWWMQKGPISVPYEALSLVKTDIQTWVSNHEHAIKTVVH